MDLKLKIEPDAFSKLEKLASASGLSVEGFIGQLLYRQVSNSQTATESNSSLAWRRSYRGTEWESMSAEEQDRLHIEGYQKFPVHPDEFAVHPDDEEAFAEDE